MDILEDPVFKSKYKKYKLRVKLWESDFTEEHGRKPNKNDIKEADIKIKESYKMYWKLKTRALEETLMDITFTDDVQDNLKNDVQNNLKDDVQNNLKDNVQDKVQENVQEDIQRNVQDDVSSIISTQMTVQETKTDKELTVDNTIIKDRENIDPRHNECSLTANDSMIKKLNDTAVAEIGCTNVKNVWGDHLSKSNRQEPQKKKNLLIGRPSSFQLSQNKFTSESFTKRNPRKSLSMSKLKNKPERTSTVVTNPDPVEQPNVNTSDDSDAKNEVKPLFGEAVKITYAEAKPTIQPGNNIQQLIEGHTVNRKLNAGWLDRCAKQNNVEYPKFDSQRLSGTSDSGIESMECSIQSPLESAPPSQSQQSVQFSDEEDFICNSDSEEERKNKRIRNFKKRLSDHENHPSKRLCIDNDSSFLNAQHPPNERSIAQASFAINAISNKVQKSDEFGDSNVSVAKVSDAFSNVEISNVNNDVNTQANLSDKEDKHDEKVHAAEKSNADEYDFTNDDEPLAPKRKTRSARRRVKKISSDDSDPEFMEEDKKSRKKKESKAKRERPERKRKVKANDAKGEKGTTVRARRSSRKKSLDDSTDNENTKDAEQSEEPQIYPIETLQTVPRFTMNSTDTRDLVEQFAKVVSTKTDSTDVSAPSKKLATLKGKLTDKEKLEKKISDGRINENFVRINIKKKVFVRGKKNFNFSKYKKNQWKQRKKELGASGGNLDVADFMEKTGSIRSCFKCGEIGHFSRYCPATRGEDLLPVDEVQGESQFPTLEEAQKMATLSAFTAHASRPQLLPEKASFSSKIEEAESTQTEEAETSQTEEAETSQTEEVETAQTEEADIEDLWEPIDDEALLCGHKIPEDLVSRLLPPEIGTVQPLYNVKADQSLIETPFEVLEALRMFGHESFRMGQEKAVMRILSGQSTLVTLSTGSGKSLCYQLPAYLYSKFSHCITLVISPLVSLMDDQVTGVPHFLSAACLHTGQTPKVRDNVMQMVKNGKVNILLVSPEAVVAGEKSTGFGALLRQLPPIAFACIDEAHCISQWSHNFRPSYLMVCRVLKEKLRVKTVLALTATATKTTAESIVRHLGIPDGMEGVISDIPMPRNLLLTVSKDEHRDQALVRLLLSERFQECDSVIVYCTRREECVRIAGLLRVHLQDPHNVEKTTSKMSSIAEAYHAGLSAYRRKTVQKLFMSGKTRVVVATVAFGMGLNKPDIRAVIHYNMPGTFEGYVQEVGRAGRDGLRAHCHLFLHPKADRDKLELRRHIFTNGIDRHIIRRLLQKVFLPCSCAKLRNANVNRRCPGHEVAIPVDETVAALDISEEIISTLLCYLELHPKRFITVLSSVYVRAKVFSYNGPNALKLAAQSSPPLAMAIAMDLQKGISHENSTSIEFPVVDVASAIGWDSGVVKSHLKNLEWTIVNGQSKRSAITVRYDTLGLRIKAPGDLNEDELDEALDALYGRAKAQESAAVQQLETITHTLQKLSVHSVLECEKLTEEEMVGKSDELKTVIRDYFQGKCVLPEDYAKQDKIENETEIVGDVRTLILSYRDTNFTGRAVARILHGIQSPNYPAYVWGKCRFWRAHLTCDFNALCQIATKEILALR